ncbi:hypothetical protein GCM10028822_30270 [Hymenobacter terrigena]
MHILIHQALFGQDQQHGQGYELLRTTHPDTRLVRRMGNSTDLGENAPSHLRWQPALRGRPWETYYLLFKTYPDTSPDVRGGRVFSHALLIEQQYLPALRDLRQLLIQFPTQLTKEQPLAPLELPELTPSPLPLTPRLGYLLKDLVRPTREGTIVWAGQADFEDAAALLWQVLPADERHQLSFNLGFMPNQLREPGNPRQLVAVPETLLPRWRPDFFVVESSDAHTALSEAEAYLAGDVARAPHLASLVQALGTPPLPHQLDTLQRVAGTAANLAAATLQQVLALAIVLHWYQPSRPVLAARTLERLLSLIALSESEEIKRLGSVQQEQLPDETLQTIGNAVGQRLLVLAADSTAVLDTLIAWPEQPARRWWRRSLREAVLELFAAGEAPASSLALGLLEQPAATVADYVQLIPTTATTEAKLLAALPATWPDAAWNNTLALAQERQWLRLHLASLLQLTTLLDALRRHLLLDNDPSELTALRLAVTQAKPKDFVAAAVVLGDDRVLGLAAELVVKQPALMGKLEVGVPGWQDLWLAVARRTGTPWTGLDRPAASVVALLRYLLGGGPVHETLLQLLSTSTYADLRAIADRTQLWPLLPVSAAAGFLRATAVALVAHEQPEDPATDLEPELLAWFSEPTFLQQAITKPIIAPGRAVAFLTRFKAPETVLLRYLRASPLLPTPAEAAALGMLVQQRQWPDAAEELLTLSKSHAPWKAALAVCFGQLSTFSQFRAYFTLNFAKYASRQQLSDSWWQMLLTELRMVYPIGPFQDAIWEDSGGENHTIHSNRNGGEQWADVLTMLRTHQTHATVARLLNELTKRHPYNSTFRHLQQNSSHA